MGHSDMDYRGRCFPAHDADLALWMQYVVAIIDRMSARPGWLDALRDDWHDQSTQGFGFGVVPWLDRHVSEERRGLMLSLFREALLDMEQHDDVMTADELNTRTPLGPKAVFTEDLPMERFRRVGRLAVALLEGSPLEP